MRRSSIFVFSAVFVYMKNFKLYAERAVIGGFTRTQLDAHRGVLVPMTLYLLFRNFMVVAE